MPRLVDTLNPARRITIRPEPARQFGSAVDLRVALLGTYPPTQCGLATYLASTRSALACARPAWSMPVIRVGESTAAGTTAAPGVVATWRPGCRPSLFEAAEEIATTDCLLFEHEYGIFGGPNGNEILDLLDVVDVPVIAVLHTVLGRPSTAQRQILPAIARQSKRLVVMSNAARQLLLERYDVPSSKVQVIPHGAHPVPYIEPFCHDRRPLLLTWGLVGPGKGLEHAIRAVALLRHRGIDVEYRIVGETHPNVRERDGERYRESLTELASVLRVADLVSFDSGYQTVRALAGHIAGADIVVIPYDSREQVTSGVLAEGLAGGKIIVATQFPHAVEVLASGCGLTVPHEDPVAMSQAIGSIVADPVRARRMSRGAHHVGRPMLWSAVAESTATLIDSTVNARNRECVPAIPVLEAGSNDAIHDPNLSQVRSAHRSSR